MWSIFIYSQWCGFYIVLKSGRWNFRFCVGSVRLERAVAIGWKWAPCDHTSYVTRKHPSRNHAERKILQWGRKKKSVCEVWTMALGDCWKQLSWFYYQYLLVTALYMLEPWERTVFSILLHVKLRRNKRANVLTLARTSAARLARIDRDNFSHR